MSFPNCRNASSLTALLLACFGSLSLQAETVSFNPVADTTLIEYASDANLGGAGFFNGGTSGIGYRNRALMQFALSDAIPAGAIINSATLTLDIVRQPGSDLQPAPFGLHRMLVSWGEGEKIPEEGSPGLGSPATDGEATWLYRNLGGQAWADPGGLAGVDFSSTASSTAFVYGIGDPVQFESTLDLTDDVQLWLNNPQANFGWMLMTETEDVTKSARSFASREDASGGPMLIIDFTPVPEPSTLGLIGVSLLAFGYFNQRRR